MLGATVLNQLFLNMIFFERMYREIGLWVYSGYIKKYFLNSSYENT